MTTPKKRFLAALVVILLASAVLAVGVHVRGQFRASKDSGSAAERASSPATESVPATASASAEATEAPVAEPEAAPSQPAPAAQAPEAAAPQAAAPASGPKVIEGFVKVADIDSSIVVDLRYATTNNFTGQKVYPTATCVLRLSTAEKLAAANAQVKKSGYRIKVWDAYRPLSVQKIFWSICPDSRYVANPYKGGSIHNRGCAVDVTLVDANGNELVMPTGFDDFSAAASPSSPNMSAEARANLDVLRKAMLGNGFTASTTEWWHFSDTNRAKYGIADVDLALF
ncbi:MAG: M15 family metallopeptidase [Coriobacteriia bacterium]